MFSAFFFCSRETCLLLPSQSSCPSVCYHLYTHCFSEACSSELPHRLSIIKSYLLIYLLYQGSLLASDNNSVTHFKGSVTKSSPPTLTDLFPGPSSLVSWAVSLSPASKKPNEELCWIGLSTTEQSCRLRASLCL